MGQIHSGLLKLFKLCVHRMARKRLEVAWEKQEMLVEKQSLSSSQTSETLVLNLHIQPTSMEPDCVWLNPWMQILHIQGGPFYIEHPWILVALGDPGTNLLWIPRDACILRF